MVQSKPQAGWASLSWPILKVGLLRETCGLTFSEMSMRMGCSLAGAHLKNKEHLRQMKTCDQYAGVAASVLNQALCQSHEPVTRIRTGIPAGSEW